MIRGIEKSNDKINIVKFIFRWLKLYLINYRNKNNILSYILLINLVDPQVLIIIFFFFLAWQVLIIFFFAKASLNNFLPYISQTQILLSQHTFFFLPSPWSQSWKSLKKFDRGSFKGSSKRALLIGHCPLITFISQFTLSHAFCQSGPRGLFHW